jgi:ring-1,2-phenylacetyl-CoA epoxidase subunit PaaD
MGDIVPSDLVPSDLVAGDTVAGDTVTRGTADTLERARRAAAATPDPELPMLTVADLGILRDVSVHGGRVTVSLTPTYSGCPALREIQADVAARLAAAGFPGAEIRMVLSPPWSPGWITAEGRRKLAAAGIAPPGRAAAAAAERAGRAPGPVPLTLSLAPPTVPCPACGSPRTERTAAFSGTACKDLYRCLSCAEPFEHMKEV